MATRRVLLPADLDLTWEEILDLPVERQQDFIARLQEHTAVDDRWTWTPKQQRLHLNCLEYDENLGGGAAGGGKSYFNVQHARWICENWHGARVGVFRREIPMLKSTLIPMSMKACRVDRGWKWRAQDKEWRLRHDDGEISVIQFCHARHPTDVRNYDSTEFACIIVDELAEWTEDMWTFLVGRLRITVEQENQGWHPHMVGTTNPGGEGHHWMKQRFVVPTAEGAFHAVIQAEPGVEASEFTVSYTPFSHADNPHVSTTYVKSLFRLSPVLRRQRMYGDWSVSEGSAFPEFSRQTHVFDADIDPSVRHRAGCDYGYRDPAYVCWGAQGYDGSIVIYREWHGTQLLPGEIVQRLYALADEPVGSDYNRAPAKTERWVWDSQIWNITPYGDTIYGRFRKAGMTNMVPAYKERHAGWLMVHEYLQPGDYAEHEDPQSCSVPPKVFITPQCPRLIAAIEGARVNPKDAEDVISTDDHPLDAFRYLICSFANLEPKQMASDDPVDAIADNLSRHVAIQNRRDNHRRRSRRSRNYPGNRG